MPRWIQHPITHKLVPADEYVRPKELSHFIHNDIESFVSPIDGSVISDRKQLSEHNKKHGVVNASEFSPEFYERKRKERERVLAGDLPKAERLKTKQFMWEQLHRLERG